MMRFFEDDGRDGSDVEEIKRLRSENKRLIAAVRSAKEVLAPLYAPENQPVIIAYNTLSAALESQP